MKAFHFISIHPEFISSYFTFGVMNSAKKLGISLNAVDLRDYSIDHRGTVDDVPYGGDDGMVLRPEPLRDALNGLPKDRAVILTSPGAKVWRQEECIKFAKDSRPLVFVCGRFAGVDQRFVDLYVDYEFSLGDFIVSGGELPSLLMADGILRECPGVLGNKLSATRDSFGSGFSGKLEHPLYTRPREFEGLSVPDILYSGDHKKIACWRKAMSEERTSKLRPDLLEK